MPVYSQGRPLLHSFHASKASSGCSHLIRGPPSLSRKSMRLAYSRKMSRSCFASPGGLTAASERWTVRSVFVYVLVFSPQVAAGKTTSASRVVSVKKISWTTTKRSSFSRMSLILLSSGKGDGWVRATYPEEVDRALLGVAEDLHGVDGRRPVRDLHQVHVPQVRQFLDVISVVPVPEGWKVAIGARLAGVLRGGLAVELQDAAARTADHTAQQVDFVDLAGRRRRLVGLVDALERGAEEPLRLPDDARGLPDPARLYATDLRRPLRGALCNSPPQFVETYRIGLDVLLVVESVLQDLVQERVEKRDVGTALYGEVDGRPFRNRCGTRIYDDELRRVRSGEPVEDAHPGHRLRLGEVVPELEYGVGVIYVGVRAWLAVGAEGLLERLGRGRRAKAGVAVHVRRTKPSLTDNT